MRRTVIDFGFNVIPYDPQTLRRDFWGACFVGALGLLGGFAATWAGLGLAFPTSVGAMAFLKAADSSTKCNKDELVIGG